MRINYKSFPFRNRGVPEQQVIWRPILPVKIIYGHTIGKRFEAVVDSGSDYCLFEAGIGEQIGIKIKSGSEGDLGGVISGRRTKVYYHNIKLMVGMDVIEIKAGFSPDLTENLLGQIGFFDHFIVTFDFTPHPPAFEIQPISRS